MAKCHHKTAQKSIESRKRQVQSEIVDKVSNCLLRQGQDRYSNWEKRKYKWSAGDYNHSGCCAIYFKRRFYYRAKLVHQVLEYCQSNNKLPSILGKDLKVVSFGCGPGCDLLGFEQFYQQKYKRYLKKYLRTYASLIQKVCTSWHNRSRHNRSRLRKTKSIIKALRNAKVSYKGYDRSGEWEKYVCKLGFTFHKQTIDARFVETMPEVDVAILSYFVSENLQGETRTFRMLWDRLKNKCSVALILDTANTGREFGRIFYRLGFTDLKRFECDGKQVYATLWSEQT